MSMIFSSPASTDSTGSRRIRRATPSSPRPRPWSRCSRLRPESRHPSAAGRALRRASHRPEDRLRDGRERHPAVVRDRERGRVSRGDDRRRRLRARRADLRDHLHAVQRHPVLFRHRRRRVLLGHQRHRLGPAVRPSDRERSAGPGSRAPPDRQRGCRIRQRGRERPGRHRARSRRLVHVHRRGPRHPAKT